MLAFLFITTFAFQSSKDHFPLNKIEIKCIIIMLMRYKHSLLPFSCSTKSWTSSCQNKSHTKSCIWAVKSSFAILYVSKFFSCVSTYECVRVPEPSSKCMFFYLRLFFRKSYCFSYGFSNSFIYTEFYQPLSLWA